jgi:hypothetical protein
MKNNTTQQGVLTKQDQDLGNFDTIDDAADAFLDRWKDDSDPSDQGKEEKKKEEVKEAPEDKDAPEDTEDTEEYAEGEDEDTEEEDQDESEEDDTDSEEEDGEDDDATEEDTEPKDKKSKVLEDDSEVEIKVGEEVKKIPVKDLKRLYGQEAALTKKSQQVAAERKEVEAQASKYVAQIDVLYKKAQAKWEPYSKVDMLLASKELDTEQFAALRQEAQEAYEEFTFVSQEADTFVKAAAEQRNKATAAAAAESVKVLTEKIPGWSTELYDKIRTFALAQGLPKEAVNNITDPNVIMLMHKARLYDEGKKVVLKKKSKLPTKMLKAGGTTNADISPNKKKSSMDQLRRSGSTDDAADAFLSRWQEEK